MEEGRNAGCSFPRTEIGGSNRGRPTDHYGSSRYPEKETLNLAIATAFAQLGVTVDIDLERDMGNIMN